MSDQTIVRLGETVTKLREGAGLSQKELAAALGMSQSLISRLEKGGQEPGLSKLVVIAEFFGLSVARLLDGDTSDAIRLPEVTVMRSVVCEDHGIVGAGMTAETARRIQAEHRREHLAVTE
ncbi:MAG TPA: helix-turn-helix transcriptional regulator [Actinoallomurus sp.]|jgi:transcriptional regulator with XRE-family HTH domain|nr:helix-turn-helix transcriptional regulator [Actinoallomurus sp.]